MTDEPPDLTVLSEALRVCKLPIPVRVRFADGDLICETLEGPVKARAGDAILTGTRGETWPVGRDLFLASYEPVPPVVAGQDGEYVKSPTVTRALRLTHDLTVPVGWQNDPLHGHPGDWLLRYEDSSHGIIQDDIFRETYGPAEGETRWPSP